MTNRHTLQTTLSESLAKHGAAGTSVAIFSEGALSTAVAGVTNTTTGIEITPDTVMHIGSITKVINTTLVMQLVDDGLVDIDEPVLKYVPDLWTKDLQVRQHITVKMLLNHTSGIDGLLCGTGHGHDEDTIEKEVRRTAGREILFKPGSYYSYSNLGMLVAGYLVQRIRGKSWYDVLKERIFNPLGMEYGAALPEEALLHRASVGHHYDAETKKLSRSSFAFLSLSYAPAGTSMMMTASDLITFAQAHLNEGVGTNGTRILSAESTRAMQRMTIKTDTKDGIGLGWEIFNSGLLFHSGGGPGIASVLYVHPGQKFAAAILTNSDNGTSVVDDVMEQWRKELGAPALSRREPLPLPAKKPNIVPEHFVGTYEDCYQRFMISKNGGNDLTVSMQFCNPSYDSDPAEPSSPEPLLALGGERFVAKSAPSSVLLFREPNAQGKMQLLTRASGAIAKRVR